MKQSIPTAPKYQGLQWLDTGMPEALEPWPSPQTEFLGPKDESKISPKQDRSEISWKRFRDYAEEHKWYWPERQLFFLCDIHADTDAFFRSLIATGGVEKTGAGDEDFRLTEIGKQALFLIGGDCLDKGPSNLRLLRAIRRFQQAGARLKILAGNHDVRTYVGLKSVDRTDTLHNHLFVRMGQKAVPLFKEIVNDYLRTQIDQLPRHDEEEIKKLLFPDEKWYNDFAEAAKDTIRPEKLQKELNRIQEKVQELTDRCAREGIDLPLLYAAVKKAQELFLRPEGEFGWFFQQMQLAYRSGSFLFIHAGVDDSIAQRIATHGVQQLNEDFREALETDLFTLYNGPLGNTFRTKYRPLDLPLTTKGTDALHQAGIHTIAHGHRNTYEGHRLVLRKGMLHIECDASVDCNTRSTEGLTGPGYAAALFSPEGHVMGISRDYPCVKLFSLEPKVYTQ